MGTHSLIIDQMAKQGWAASGQFLPQPVIGNLVEEAKSLLASGGFKPASIGRGPDFKVRPDIRSDHIAWLDDESLSPAMGKYLAEIERLKAELNREFFAGLQEFEAHFAVFQAGTSYKKHLDRFSTADERAFSCSLYLNAGWRKAHGGALRLYTDKNNSKEFLDVYPQAGNFIIFRSNSIYHEVLPAIKERFSITGWFKRRALRV